MQEIYKPIEAQILYDYLMKLIGIPYKWGGNNPVEGLDCSGMVCEALRSQGLVAYNEDLPAQGIFEKFSSYKQGGLNEVAFGSILFFGSSINSLSHVTFALSNKTMIEAGGGDSRTKTLADAMSMNAFVKVSPITRRKDFVCSVMPPYSWIF